MAVKRLKIDNHPQINLSYHKGYYYDNKKHSKLIQEAKHNFSWTNNKDFYTPIKCPKCGGAFVFKKNSEKMYYECKKCGLTMNFIEYQKRYINLNWFKSVELGIKLYSWDSLCPNCNNYNPCISYCLNQTFGTEELCLFEPILLGESIKLDNFIMKFCRAINLFPNENQELVATIICSKCDAPYPHNFLVKSFLEQKIFDVEFVIKKDALKNIINLKVSDITKLLNNLKLIKD